MVDCGARCIEILKEFVGSIAHRAIYRALDVAGGDGRVSVEFLLKHYKKVDLID